MRTALAILFASLLLASAATAQPEPKTAKEFIERGEKALKNNDLLGASRDFTEALALDPKSADAYFGRGEARTRLGWTEKAIEDYSEAIKLDPKHARAFAARGSAQQAPDKALADLNEALKLEPKLTDALADRGQHYARKGEYEKALTDFAAAIKLEPKRPLWYGRRAVALFNAGRVEESLADLDEAIKLDPKEVEFLGNRSQFRLAQGRDLAGALKDADEAIRLAPKEPLAHYQRASVQFARGEWAEARKSLDEAIRLGPNLATTYTARAGLLACCPDAKHLDPKQAFKDADRACELTEWKDPYAVEALAAASAALGDFTGAVKWQKKAAEDPAYAKTAQALSRLTAYEAKRVVRFAPPILDIDDPREFVARGNHYFTTGEYDRAIRDYDAALRLDPKSAKAFYGRGCARARRDDDIKALLDFTEAIKLDPKDVSSFVDRGLVRLTRGEWELALADLDAAVKLDPKHVNALTHRAMIRASAADPTYRSAEKALADAKLACDLTGWKAGYPLEGYAAACAEAKDFDEAVKWQSRAAADDEYAARRGVIVRGRLLMYQAKQPLRTGTPQTGLIALTAGRARG